MTGAEAEAVVLALRILHQGGPPQNGLIWLNRVCPTHRFELARRGRRRVIVVEQLSVVSEDKQPLSVKAKKGLPCLLPLTDNWQLRTENSS